MLTAFHGLLLFIVAQRLAELAWSARNTRRLLARGGREVGAGHYPLFVLLHGCWLAALALFVDADQPLALPWLVAFAILQAGRLWVIATLGPFWTTRIITVDDSPLCDRGPYRLFRHPNYLIVAGEIAVVPLAVDAIAIAIVFSLLNAALLGWRIRLEERALHDRRGRMSGA